MCPIVDGMSVNAANENAQKLDKVSDDTASGIITLANSATASGSSVTNVQREHNSVASFVGKSLNSVKNDLPTWVNNDVGVSTDPIKTRADNLTAKFNSSSGHTHDGTAGNGGPVAATSLGGLTSKGVLLSSNGTSAATLTVGSNGQVLTADSTQSTGLKWATASSGGGGGGSIQWVEQGTNAIPSVDQNNLIYSFQSNGGQNMFCLLRVPSGYTSGQQVKMRLTFYSPDSSGNALMQTVATLIRVGTDAISSTTNQRTSTNSAVTLGAGTVNIPQAVVFDVTDASGQINSVSASAGDLIKVQLSRGTDTATSDLAIPVYGTEVTFNG